MLTLEKAREIQGKRCKASLLMFGGFVLLSAVSWGVLFFFTDYLNQYRSLYVAFPVLWLIGAKVSRVHILLCRKEFTGKVVDSNIKMTTARRYGTSNQPGTTYAASEIPVLEITVENDVGKRVCKETPYQWAWGEYKPGQEVALLRFIDQPILLQDI